jgi:hypothetical protein
MHGGYLEHAHITILILHAGDIKFLGGEFLVFLKREKKLEMRWKEINESCRVKERQVPE